MWEQLNEPFDEIPVSRAIAILKWHWELQPTSIEPLDTERDDSFHVVAADGDGASQEYVLKISHPGDDPHFIGMQSAAMRHASEAGLPVQLLVPTTDGSTHPVEHGRVMRLLTWIPGDLLLAHWPDAAGLESLGERLATLNAALASFEHPAAHRTFAWDLRAIGDLRELLDLAPTPTVATVIDEVEAALPEYEAMPGQVVHGDFHPGNVIVDADGKVTGILDFGDTINAPRILDLAISLSYFVPREGDAAATVAPFIAGWERVLPLTDQERGLLPTLVAGRLAQRILLGAFAAGGRPDRLYAVARLGDALDNWRRTIETP
jgi:Ser/Thr protein kinase RdoA (MazF antagonist)